MICEWGGAMNVIHQTRRSMVKTAELVTVPQVLLSGIRWETYQHLLQDYGERGSVHFAFDRGKLEITTITFAHARLKQLLTLLVTIIAEELEVDVDCVGSMTLQRSDLACGLEPDVSFYIQHAAQVRGKATIDLAIDPPPDLVIMIDIAEPVLNKFSIFAALSIPEFWHYDGTRVRVWRLTDAEYDEVVESGVLACISSTLLTELAETGRQMNRTAWLHQVRRWVRSTIETNETESLLQ
jgi:Uma2 family endonuclease